MRLRNLFMILLLCMTVGVFSACTGDDGATGPQGPPGPAGPAGEPGDDGDGSGGTAFYSFLKAWGSPTGEIACSSPLLTGSGPLPGPDTLAKLSAPSPTVEAAHVVAACANILSSISAADVNQLDDALDLPDGTGGTTAAFTAGEALVFIKTGKGQEVSREQVPSSEFNQARQVTTTKTFVGGKVFADMDAGESDQALERLDLYSECGVGTAPTNLVGTWRAVTIVEDPVPYVDGLPQDVSDAAAVRTTTLKVCANFDSLPGVTKCYVNVNAPGTANDSEQIAIYDGMNLHTVVSDTMLGADATADVSFITTTDVASARLCRIF